MLRKIIRIDEEKCNGCGNCIPACPEQAIQIVDGKARLVKEFYCDGLGACLGSCPTGALTIEEKDVSAYDEEATIAHIKETSPQMLIEHLKHLREHASELPQHHSHRGVKGGCPSAQALSWGKGPAPETADRKPSGSELRQWPIQLHLVNPDAPYFKNADLLVAADCVSFAYGDFHRDFLRKKALVIACPKLDDTGPYVDKLARIIKRGRVKSLMVVHMEVPCCFGLRAMVEEAVKLSGREVPVEHIVIGIKGERK